MLRTVMIVGVVLRVTYCLCYYCYKIAGRRLLIQLMNIYYLCPSAFVATAKRNTLQFVRVFVYSICVCMCGIYMLLCVQVNLYKLEITRRYKPQNIRKYIKPTHNVQTV